MGNQRSMAGSTGEDDPFLAFCYTLRSSFNRKQLSQSRGFEQLGLPPRVGKSWFQAANKGRVLLPQVRHLEIVARSNDLNPLVRAHLEQLWLRRSADPMPRPDPACGASSRTLIASRIAAAHLSRSVYLLELAESHDTGAVSIPFLQGKAHPHHVLLQFLDPDLDSVAVPRVVHFKRQDATWDQISQRPLNWDMTRIADREGSERLHQAAVYLFDAAHGPFVRQEYLSKLHVEWLIAACLREAAISLLATMTELAEQIEEQIDHIESKIPSAMRVHSAGETGLVRDTMDRYVAAANVYKRMAEQLLVDRIARGIFVDTGNAPDTYYGVDLQRARNVSSSDFTSLRHLIYSAYCDDSRAAPEEKVLSLEVETGRFMVSRLGLPVPTLPEHRAPPISLR